jgi:pimeloyl-ACP methyl ester carboxylesterase
MCPRATCMVHIVEHSLEYLKTDVLDLAYERRGDPQGFPVVLVHGFPYDPRSFDDTAAQLARSGADVVVPYLRGYGPTRFRSGSTQRSGQQGALASDLRDLVDGLQLHAPIVAGFDWGGRAACAMAALWPHKIGGLVAIGGYSVYDVTRMASVPDVPELEARDWHQWYFQIERGRAGLHQYRRELARQLWSEWSPGWLVDDATFEATATSFDNPDFVDVVVHSYRVRYGLTPGDPAFASLEETLSMLPPIDVPSIVIDPTNDAVMPPLSRDEHEKHFTRLIDYRRTPVGHNTPQEDPESLVAAILDLHAAKRAQPGSHD